MIPLRDATHAKHKQAEEMPFNNRMFNSLLSKSEYLLYLQQQLQVFEAIEAIGLPHDSLKRAEEVKRDIEELEGQGYSADHILNSTRKYTDYLSSLTYEEVLPHVYLNYLAIMFGGQMIKKKVPSTGHMYNFDNMKEAMQSVRAVQKDEWADEVNKGFDFNISIFEELETECTKGQLTSAS